MNIGCVVYKKDFATGKMTAEWRFQSENSFVSGTGEATGEPGETYSGKYAITYRDSNGKESGPFELIITERDDFHILQWFRNGGLKCSGIGMSSGDLLIAGWRNVNT